MIGAVAVMDLPAKDLAAVEVDDQVQIEALPNDPRGQEGDIPAPHLIGCLGEMGGGGPAGLRGFGTPAMAALIGLGGTK